MVKNLLAALITVAAASALVLADPYLTEHFELYDAAGAGQAYLAALADVLESAYNRVKSIGVSLAPPCGRQRYTVYVVSSNIEGGVTSTLYIYDSEGRVLSSCVAHINFTRNLSGPAMRKTVYHELMHVAQAAYYRYVSILHSCPWYVEGTAEGFACYLTGVCSSEPRYYDKRLYYLNPYSIQCAREESYSTGAFFHWLVSSGYASMPTAFERIFSSSNVQIPWLNAAYASFLLSIVKGQGLCGAVYRPYMQAVRLTGDQWSTSVTLEGLSARYYIIELPGSCTVEVKVTGSAVLSNLKLNEPFRVENQTLYLALVNPSPSAASLTLTVSASGYLSARIAGGRYDAATGQLEIDLSVAVGSAKITGQVYVNGTPYRADNGRVVAQLAGLSWGSYALLVSYEGLEATLRFSINPPVFTPVTKSPIYISMGCYGRIVVRADNPNPFKVYTSLLLEPPSIEGSEPLLFESKVVDVELQPGQGTIELPFAANRPSSQGELLIRVRYGSSSPVVARYTIVPADISVIEVTYNSTTDVATAKLFVPQLGAHFVSSFSGFSGEASAVYDTYVIGSVNLQIPAIAATLRVEPEVVAPSWLLTSVEASVATSGACPAFPVIYWVQLRVNSTTLGSASLLCGEAATLKGFINSTRPRGAWRVKFTANDRWSTVVELTPPRVDVTPSSWLIHDEGITLNVTVSAFGPHRYYVANMVLSNSSGNLVLDFPKGSASVSIDLGFAEASLTVPPVRLYLEIPPVTSSPLVKGRLRAETSALLNSSLSLKLNGTEVLRVKLSKTGEAPVEEEFALNLSTLGLHEVSLEAWFARASASIYYAEVRGVSISAPQFLLVGGKALVNVTLYAQPPLPLPLNLTLARHDRSHTVTVRGNSTLELSFNEPVVVEVTASILNYTASTLITWDCLNLHLENVLEYLGEAPVLPNTAVKAYAAFSNGTRVPAAALVNGREFFQPESLGENVLTLSVGYLGRANETRVRVYVVPENLYREALDLLAFSGGPKSLAESIRTAVTTGRWADVEKLVTPYRVAKSRAEYYDPLGILALELVKRSAVTGDLALSLYAKTLLDYEVAVYLSAAALAVVVIARRRFRQQGPEEGGAAP